MKACPHREHLLREKDEAWQDFYSEQAKADGLLLMGLEAAREARDSAAKAYKRVEHLMREILSHYGKHRCNVD